MATGLWYLLWVMVESMSDEWCGEIKMLTENLLQCHFV